jgi:hypothetical protein
MTRDTVRIIVAAGAVSFCIGVPAFLYVALTSEKFVVDKGFHTRRGTYAQSRGCLGFRYKPDSRDGWFVQCVGIPIGPWTCRNEFYDDDGNIVNQNKSCE